MFFKYLGSNFPLFKTDIQMHELSVVLGIVRIAEEETKKAGANSVEAIDLEIGTLAGIEFDSLEFVWPSAVKDSVLEHAEKNVYIIQAKARCLDCNHEFDIQKYYDSCPICRSSLKGIVQGKELRVKALEVI